MTRIIIPDGIDRDIFIIDECKKIYKKGRWKPNCDPKEDFKNITDLTPIQRFLTVNLKQNNN